MLLPRNKHSRITMHLQHISESYPYAELELNYMKHGLI